MQRFIQRLLAPCALVLMLAAAHAEQAERVHVTDGSDPKAIALAQAVVEASGGWDGWDDTRYLSWKFFGNRQHWLDRQAGKARIEFTDREGVEHLMLLDVHSKQGRAWSSGEELKGDDLTAAMERAHQIWINDTYWMFLPFKLLDPGVTLTHGGRKAMEDGRQAEVLELTFDDGIGYTPDNKYEVWVGADSGLIEAWTFYANATDEEPRFTMPWADWKPFGKIKLATNHGRGVDWDIHVHDELPAALFTDPTASAE